MSRIAIQSVALQEGQNISLSRGRAEASELIDRALRAETRVTMMIASCRARLAGNQQSPVMPMPRAKVVFNSDDD